MLAFIQLALQVAGGCISGILRWLLQMSTNFRSGKQGVGEMSGWRVAGGRGWGEG